MNKILLLTSWLVLLNIGTLKAQIPTPPPLTPTQCSLNGDAPTRIMFVNQAEEVVSIYWVDYQCNLQFYKSLAPGESYEQGTYATHPWIVIGNTTGQILARAVGTADRQTVDIPRTALSRSTTDRPDDTEGYQVQILYVLASDGLDQQLDSNDTLIKSVYAWNEWLAQQTNGTRLRLDTYGGQIDIVFVRLNSTDAQLAGEGVYIRDRIERELGQLGFNHPQKLYAVYYGGTANEVCGGGPLPPDLVGRVAAVYLNGQFADPNILDCNQNAFGTVAAMGYWEFSALHEIFHALGAVPDCAPHHTRRGHSSDTPRDLMYAGDELWQPQVVDEGRDDYYGHTNADCLDIADSAFLDPLPANPLLPPGWEALQG